MNAIWDDPAMNDQVVAYARTFLAEMELFSTGGLYLNFAGLGEENETPVKEGYGEKYDRQVALKSKYEPCNLFHLNQNFKPAA